MTAAMIKVCYRCISVSKGTDCTVTLTDMSMTNVRLCNLATQAGIGTCLTRSSRLETISLAPTTLILAIKAIIGACWIDCGRRVDVVHRVLCVLGSVRRITEM